MYVIISQTMYIKFELFPNVNLFTLSTEIKNKLSLAANAEKLLAFSELGGLG